MYRPPPLFTLFELRSNSTSPQSALPYFTPMLQACVQNCSFGRARHLGSVSSGGGSGSGGWGGGGASQTWL